MRILVDADACPVKDIIIEISKTYNIECQMYFDTSHEYVNDEVKVFFCDKGKDSVDLCIIGICQKGDIVITQDYGLSCLALTKGCKVLHINGFEINTNNIDSLLFNRYVGGKMRKHVHIKGPKKRTDDNDLTFYKGLIKIIEG